MQETLKTLIIRLDERLNNIIQNFNEYKKSTKETIKEFITRREFVAEITPLKRIVYGVVVGLILAFLGAILGVVLK